MTSVGPGEEGGENAEGGGKKLVNGSSLDGQSNHGIHAVRQCHVAHQQDIVRLPDTLKAAAEGGVHNVCLFSAQYQLIPPPTFLHPFLSLSIRFAMLIPLPLPAFPLLAVSFLLRHCPFVLIPLRCQYHLWCPHSPHGIRNKAPNTKKKLLSCRDGRVVMGGMLVMEATFLDQEMARTSPLVARAAVVQMSR